MRALNQEPPHDIEAEWSVLGAIMIDTTGDAIDKAISLAPQVFYDPMNRTIFSGMVELHNAGEQIDIRSLTGALLQWKSLDKVGGVHHLSQIARSSPTAANIEYFIGILNNKFTLREALKNAYELIEMVHESEDADAVVSHALTKSAALSDQSAPKQDFKSTREIGIAYIETIEQRVSNRLSGTISGKETGFKDLDKLTGGFQKQDLIIVAARPSVGKTAFALNIAQNAAKLTNEPIAVFSLEMSEQQLMQRMVCAEVNLDANDLRMGDITSDDDWGKLTIGISSLADKNILIADDPVVTVHDIRAKCRRLKREQGLGMIIIDYLQLIQGSSGKRGENRQQEVSEISRVLKQIARELDVPVIALSQLSRKVEERQDKRPMMSDLRESGSIEQDADIVAFLYRDDYYNQESEKKNIIEIIISKQRNGPTGTVELVFLKNFNKFVNYERAHVNNLPQPA
ncbi:replicative DNA helicase [Paenibacillus sp. FSL K6-3166]|uniref:replicative DNA helicase n=1 Tax=unclassified Paenibacillus TaxID=185978 RepID=UPI000BA04B81|nr:replicative DNA helicase [Paenibacillus sp. VTT E-133291]OZQ95829.1 replicative DNA helicase [Paenibacillus sp. VTT E-133291]